MDENPGRYEQVSSHAILCIFSYAYVHIFFSVLCCGCAAREHQCQHRIIAFCDKCNEEHKCHDKHNCSESTIGQLISKANSKLFI